MPENITLVNIFHSKICLRKGDFVWKNQAIKLMSQSLTLLNQYVTEQKQLY